jgi:hypothetical protein
MNMDRRKLTQWGVLIVSAAITIYQVVNRGPSRPPVTITTPDAAPAAAPGVNPSATPAAAVPAGDPAASAAPVPPLPAAELVAWRTSVAAATRDPFFTAAELEAMGRPAIVAPAPVAPPATLPAYTLKLVLMSGSDGRALVDGQVVRVGDQLGEERVAQILPDAVVLERDGERRRLELASATSVQLRVEQTR